MNLRTLRDREFALLAYLGFEAIEVDLFIARVEDLLFYHFQDHVMDVVENSFKPCRNSAAVFSANAHMVAFCILICSCIEWS